MNSYTCPNCGDVQYLGGATEIAEAVGVERHDIQNWAVLYDTFPKPKLDLSRGRLWDIQEVRTWHEQNAPSRRQLRLPE